LNKKEEKVQNEVLMPFLFFYQLEGVLSPDEDFIDKLSLDGRLKHFFVKKNKKIKLFSWE